MRRLKSVPFANAASASGAVFGADTSLPPLRFVGANSGVRFGHPLSAVPVSGVNDGNSAAAGAGAATTASTADSTSSFIAGCTGVGAEAEPEWNFNKASRTACAVSRRTVRSSWNFTSRFAG